MQLSFSQVCLTELTVSNTANIDFTNGNILDVQNRQLFIVHLRDHTVSVTLNNVHHVLVNAIMTSSAT